MGPRQPSVQRLNSVRVGGRNCEAAVTTRFDSPWDGGVKIVTAMTFVIVGGAAVLLLTTLGRVLHTRYPHPAMRFVPLVFAFVPVALLFAAALDAPRGLSLGDTALRIERRAGPVSIPLSTIREVRELPPGTRFWRLVGSGGFLGHFGTFRNSDLGSVRMYATRSDGRVLVATDDRKYVVTPANPAEFLAEVRGRMERNPG